MISSSPMIELLRRFYISVASTKIVGSCDASFFKIKVEGSLNLHRSTHFACTRENINDSRILLSCDIYISMKERYNQRYWLALPISFTPTSSLLNYSMWAIKTFVQVVQHKLVKQYNNYAYPEVDVSGPWRFEDVADRSFGGCRQNYLRHIFLVPTKSWNPSASFRGTLLFATSQDYEC
jgi:hypothetical protein